MIWICLMLFLMCVTIGCVALHYRAKWVVELRKVRHLESLSDELTAKLWQERDKVKTLGKQLYPTKEKQLPKRDSKGRFCKRKEER